MATKSGIPGWGDAMGALPGFSSPLTDNSLAQTFAGSFDFMKNLWGSLPGSMPGLVVPTIDVGELDKRIKDLKAVESWLEVNANMLRGTIQALEVQRNTVATLHSLGGSIGGSAQDILKTMGNFASAAKPPGKPVSQTASDASSAPPPAPQARRAKRATGARSKSSASGASATGASGGGAAGAWLDFLQNQFNQVALAALTPGDSHAPPKKAAAPRTSSPTKSKGQARSHR
jgi:hypothetical protein